jgi:hypothetical protein
MLICVNSLLNHIYVRLILYSEKCYYALKLEARTCVQSVCTSVCTNNAAKP